MQVISETGVGGDARTRGATPSSRRTSRRGRPALLRTAYLLTGDRHQAEDLVQTALAKLYLAWDRVQDRDSVDGYVRRIMVNENNSLWRRAWKRRELTTDDCPRRASHDDLRRRAAAPRCGSSCRRCPARPGRSWCCATTRS